jgi:Putative Ig domain
LNSARFCVTNVQKFSARVAAVVAIAVAAAVVPAAAAVAAPVAPATSAAKIAPATSPTAGTSIGNAGLLTGSGTGAIVTGSDDWWVIYASSPGATVSVTVTDNAAAGSSCTGIWAGLYDSTGTENRISSDYINPGTAQQLAGRQAGSDRYYLEVDAWGCASDTSYALTLGSGGGGTPPALASGSIAAGTGVGNAWPPLQGGTLYPATLSASSSEDWYAVYKTAGTAAASIRISNTTVAGSVSCGGIVASLYDNTGTENRLNIAYLSDNGTVTFQLPGSEASDPQGRYYIDITTWSCSNGGQTYSIEPEPASQYANPTRVPFAASTTPGTSVGSAWPPLQGGLVYAQTLSASSSEGWYSLYKKSSTSAATIRVTNTTVDGSVACTGIVAYLYDSTGTGNRLNTAYLNGNGAVTFSLNGTEANDPQGRYYLEITTWSCSNGGQTYTVEPEPGSQYANPTRVPFATTSPGLSLATAWPPLQGGLVYRHQISAGGSEDWYALYKRSSASAATIRVTNTTVDGSVACGGVVAYLYDSTGTGNRLNTAYLSDNQITTFSLNGTEPNDPQGRYYLEITTWSCSNGGQTYTVEPEPAAQYGNPVRVPTARGVPATSAGGAWPPLRGGVATYQTLGSGTDEDWYVLYKKADTASGTIRITNTTVDGTLSCSGVVAVLYNYTGQDQLYTAYLSDNQVVTFNVSGKETGSAQGRYFLELTPWGCSNGGQSYGIEPEQSTEWNAASTTLPIGTSKKTALGPLSANTNYTASVTSSTAQDWWYFIAKAALTVRVSNTSSSTAGCNLATAMYNSANVRVAFASFGSGAISSLKIPKAGTYYLELSTGGCKPKAAMSALVELLGSVTGPVLKVSNTTLRTGTHGKAYSATIPVAGGKKPYGFTAVTALPSGLTLNRTTGAVTGKPAKKGSYTFTVTINDSTKPTHNILTVLIHIKIS